MLHVRFIVVQVKENSVRVQTPLGFSILYRQSIWLIDRPLVLSVLLARHKGAVYAHKTTNCLNIV